MNPQRSENVLLSAWARRRALILTVVYGCVILVSFYLAYEVRFDFYVPPEFQADRLNCIWMVVVLKLAALFLAQQFGSMLTYFSIRDLFRLIWAMSISSGILLLLRLTSLKLFMAPRGVLLVDYLICLAALCAVRLATRLYRERITVGRGTVAGAQEYIAIVGAGDVGASLASEFINAPARGFKPVAFFDDDPEKHGQLVHGVPVLGRPELITSTSETVQVSKIVIAMPKAPAKRVREIVLYMTGLGLKVETVPSLEELTSGRARASRIRPVEVQDLLGRDAVDLDSASIRKFIEGRVVMVTGAGGSIGSELCRQIAVLNPKRLLMVDQAEGSLFTIEQELEETGVGVNALPLVADILDDGRMEFIFHRYRPEVVFHAAAHKHVFLMERQPAEAIHNNVIGTRSLAQRAAAHGVKEFVFISTDKAINPTSVMGATKRLAEIQILAIQALQPDDGTKFMAVRFGNVLGSSGSVIPIFKRQIANGGPVTVTHPEVTRYFMTIPEAVGLVLQSAVLGSGGEIFVLDMGQPVKIIDLAHHMIKLSGFKPGEDIEIKFTGLKPGEKLYEEIQHQTEEYRPTEHPRIMHFASQTTFSESKLHELEGKLHELEPVEVKKYLQYLLPEYAAYLE
jgi:FlaA1/EpsC-like NDP-sugar epimerase